MKKSNYIKPMLKTISIKTRYGVMGDTLSDPNHSNPGDEVIHYGGETGGDGPDPEAKPHYGVWDDWG